MLELEEGYKIKEESQLQPNIEPREASYEALTKVVQFIFNEINTWRERLPNKFEDLSIWRSILEQRNVMFGHLRKRMQELLDSNLKINNIQEPSSKLLVPYTDIEWNNLKMMKQQRIFGIFSISKYNVPDEMLYYEDVFLKNKELYYYYTDCVHNHEKAGSILNEALVTA